MHSTTVTLYAYGQTYASLVLLAIAYFFERRRRTDVPVPLRPAVIVALTVVVSSLAALNLEGTAYVSYLELWSCQFAGVLLGIIFTRTTIKSPKDNETKRIDEKRARRLAMLVLGVSVASSFLFFAWMGVPILQNNIEQGRVDAAIEGTGYLRLVSYFSIPASIVLLALQGRRGIKFVVLAALIILGMANRSPLLYLIVPSLYIFIALSKRKLTTSKILVAALFAATVIVGIGTFRIFSQDEFASYDEYRDDIREGNFLGVALTSLTHYAQVVSDNAVLTKELVDSGLIEHKFGSSYFILFITALPGEQLSLDREIKLASGKTFVGGGTPPTLMGEGYVNFSYVGTVFAGFAVILLLEFWFRQAQLAHRAQGTASKAVAYAIYGYMACWVILSQVAGLVGASTFPFACALILTVLWTLTSRKGTDAKSTSN